MMEVMHKMCQAPASSDYLNSVLAIADSLEFHSELQVKYLQ